MSVKTFKFKTKNMKMKWIQYKILVLVPLAMIYFSCSDDEQTNQYDPAKPVIVTNFLPDSGRINEKFIVKGENFGSDVSKIHVFFNEKEAQVISSSGDVIYGLVPRSPGVDCTIKVRVDEQETTFEERTYRYIISESVTTLLGKLDETGQTDQVDGTFAETMLNGPAFVCVDGDGNLFIFETYEHAYAAARVRMANEEQDKVVTLAEGDLVNAVFQPVITPDKQTIYVPVTQKARILVMEKSDGWTPRVFVDFTKAQYKELNNIINNNMRVHSLALDDDGYLYLRTNQGRVVKVNTEDKSAVALDVQLGNGGQNGYLVFNPKDKKIYCTLHVQHKIMRFNKDGSDLEDFVGSTQGFADGEKASAKFNQPRGIAVDEEGSLFVADCNNNRIRKVTVPEGIVTTYAGTGTAGWQDGIPEDAQFQNPWGVCVDNDGFVIVADRENHRIRRIAIE